MQILIDMDDTLTTFIEVLVDRLNERHGYCVPYTAVTSWDIAQTYPGLTPAEVFAPTLEPSFWDDVEPKEGAAQALRDLAANGHRVYVVTASHPATVFPKTERALFRHFPFLTPQNLIVAPDKRLIRGDVLVDDAPQNFGGQGAGILFTAYHNRGFNAQKAGLHRADSWKDVMDIISKL